MKVSISLDDKEVYETNLPECNARKLFNDFVCDAMSYNNKVAQVKLEEHPIDEKSEEEVVIKKTPTTNIKKIEYPKGFLYLKCDKCGKSHGFCSTKSVKSFKCDFCGSKTPLIPEELRVAHLYCPKCKKLHNPCGGRYTYTTNINRNGFVMKCFNCNTSYYMQYSKEDEAYNILKEE